MTGPPREDVLAVLKAALGGGFLSAEGEGPDARVVVEPASLRLGLELLKGGLGFNVLVDLTAADYLGFGEGERLPGAARPPAPAPEGGRFKLTYRLMRLHPASGLAEARLAVQCWVAGGAGAWAPRSVMDLWPAADWLEREVWDMFGVRFSDRPDIRRLLLYEEFQGHPLRKDYPINKRQPRPGCEPGPAPGIATWSGSAAGPEPGRPLRPPPAAASSPAVPGGRSGVGPEGGRA